MFLFRKICTWYMHIVDINNIYEPVKTAIVVQLHFLKILDTNRNKIKINKLFE